jgi:hypothetical protein
MIKTDANGDTLWTREYGSLNFDNNFIIIRQLPDGNFIAAGSKRDSIDLGYYIWLLKLDEQGDMIWERQFTYLGGITHNYVEDMIITPEGDIAMTGYIIAVGNPNHTTGNDMHIIKADSCGYIESDSIDAQFSYEQTDTYEITFTDQSQHYCTALWYFGDGDSTYTTNPLHTYADTGTYTVTLIVRAGNSLDTITQQVVVSGTVGVGNQETGIGNQVRVYPNPAEDVINVQLVSLQSSIKIKAVGVYDVAGKAVLSGSPNTPQPPSRGDSRTINVSGLMNGLYFLHIEMSNGERVVRKVMKE